MSRRRAEAYGRLTSYGSSWASSRASSCSPSAARAGCTLTGSDEVVRVDGDREGGLVVGRRVAAPGGPYGLAADGAGRTWVALNQAGALAQVTDGHVRLVALPDGSAPVGLACTDDAVWVADIGGGRILRVPVSAEGQDERAAVQSWSLDPASRPHAVIADPDGGCWFTEWGANRLGRIDAAGALTERDLAPFGTEPHGLVSVGGAVLVALESGALVRLGPR